MTLSIIETTKKLPFSNTLSNSHIFMEHLLFTQYYYLLVRVVLNMVQTRYYCSSSGESSCTFYSFKGTVLWVIYKVLDSLLVSLRGL